MGAVLEEAGASVAARAAAPSRRIERRGFLIALSVFAANLALVLPLVGAQSIWFDEAVTMRNAQQPFDLALYMSADATPPLYPWLVHHWMRVFGVSLEVARTLSVLASALTAVLLFRLGRRFVGERAGLYAALLFTFSRFQIFFAHEARPYAVVGLLCVASFHVLLALLESPTRRRAALLALLDAALLYTHYVAVFALVAQAVAVLWVARRERSVLLTFVASQAAAALLFLPCVLRVAALWPLPMAGWLAPPTARGFVVELAKLVGDGTLLALEVVLVAGGLAWIARTTPRAMPPLEPRVLRVLLSWSVVPLVAAWLVSNLEPMFLARYLLYTAAGIFLLVGAVASRLPIAAPVRDLVVAGLCALSLLHALAQPIVRQDWRAAAALVASATRAGALGVIVPAHQMLPFAYHAAPDAFRDPEHLVARVGAGGVVGVPRPDDVPGLALGGRPVVVVMTEATAAGAAALEPRLDAAGYDLAAEQRPPGLVVRSFTPRRAGAREGAARP